MNTLLHATMGYNQQNLEYMHHALQNVDDLLFINK